MPSRLAPRNSALPPPGRDLLRASGVRHPLRLGFVSVAQSGASAPGLLVATLDAMGATRRMTYDGLGSMDTINYAEWTAGRTYWYDFDARLAQVDEIAFGYNADGTIAWKYSGDGGSGGTSLVYSYYPDSLRAGLSATTSRNSTGDTVNQPNLFSYAYLMTVASRARHSGSPASQSPGHIHVAAG